MLFKLYKKEQEKTLYWEAWPEGDEIVVHFGVLGQPGETTNLSLPEFEPPETALHRQATEARAAGFTEIDETELFELILQYPNANSLSKPEQCGSIEEQPGSVEELLNDCLGWTGLGHCDGHDMGYALNFYCYVVDPRLACQAIVSELTANELLNQAVIAYQDRNEDFVVLWPENFVGVFEY
jgi:hypothetical protein